MICIWIKAPGMGTEKKARLVSFGLKNQNKQQNEKNSFVFLIYKENEEERLGFLDAWIMKLISNAICEYLWKMKLAKNLT